MASKSAESEAMFERSPIADIEQEKELGESAPFGPVAPLKSFKTSSLSVDKRLENVYYDKDLRAAEAVIDLYQKEVEASRIHRILSMGMLGLQKNSCDMSYRRNHRKHSLNKLITFFFSWHWIMLSIENW